jgi:hydroxymethylpyrimidine pyrophosphatase-like HAD family hydrolase
VVRTEYGRSWDAPPLHAGDVDKILAAVAPFRCAVNLYSAGRWYTSNSADPRVRDEAQRLGVSPDAFDNGLAHEFHKILLLAGPDVLSRCERVLQDIPPATRLRWFRSEPSYLEIGRADVTKGGGALVVKDWLQPRRTYAIGDGYSDITLFRAVDVAIAVANAPRVVRDAAHVTVASNDADGVAEAITRILDGEL